MRDPTQRFSSRVENYARWRPRYPAAVIDLLRAECGLGPGARVADVGSGTGILTEMLLDAGARVFAVEPNPEMRAAAERMLGDREGFTSVAARAEETTLPDHLVDLVTAAQSFHWFDASRARAEFSRILVSGGRAAAIWNMRRHDATPFQRDYEALLQQYGTDYAEVRHRGAEAEAPAPLFAEGQWRVRAFEYSQSFDFEGLLGRLLSSSYAPEPGHPSYRPMVAELRRIFQRHAREGQVRLDYDTRVHYGAVG